MIHILEAKQGKTYHVVVRLLLLFLLGGGGGSLGRSLSSGGGGSSDGKGLGVGKVLLDLRQLSVIVQVIVNVTELKEFQIKKGWIVFALAS